MPWQPLALFQLLARGVNTVTAPTHLRPDEATRAQNAELSPFGGEGGVDQRPGMSLVNSTGSLGSPIIGVHDVPAQMQYDLTPTLYVSMNTGHSPNGMRFSNDGVTWNYDTNFINDEYPMNGFVDMKYFKALPKMVTVNNKIYFIGQPSTTGQVPLHLYQWDGTQIINVSDIPQSVAGVALATPAAPSISGDGVVSGPQTNWTYVVVARDSLGNHSAASASSSVTFNSTLTNSAYIVLNLTNPVSNAVSYDVYRTVAGTFPSTTGLIVSVPIVNGQFTTGNGSFPSAFTVVDAGLTGDGTTAPVSGTGSGTSYPIAVPDIITDGTLLYFAVADVITSSSGRIIQFDPVAIAWSQIGALFPTAIGNGFASTLINYTGALSYGTYVSGTGTSTYLTSTNTPLPAGGIFDVKTTSASVMAASMIVFQGQLYVGTAWVGAGGTAATILQRSSQATWTSVQTGPGTATNNAYTSLGIYNGRLFAGWSSGDGATAAQIQSSANGNTWVTDFTGTTGEVVGGMQVFNGNLYVVMGKTAAGGSTTSRVLQRNSSGTWTTVDPAPGGGVFHTGGIGILFH